MAEGIDPSFATAGKPCHLGNEPATYLDTFDEWLEETSLLTRSLGIKYDTQKLNLMLLWGGRELRRLAKAAGEDVETKPPPTYGSALARIRAHCGTHVNLSMTMFRLMHARQGDKTVMEFLNELDVLSTQCQLDTYPYTRERAQKDAFIFGTSDDRLRQEALAKDLDLQALVKTALGYEQSRKSSTAIKAEAGDQVRKLYSEDEVEEIVARVTKGRYSSAGGTAPNKTTGRTEKGNTGKNPHCRNCPPHYRPHPPGRCPARGKTCVLCGEKGHFVGAENCTRSRVRFTTEEGDYHYGSEDGVGRIMDVAQLGNTHANLARVKVNGTMISFYVDSGCNKTLLPAHIYSESLGKLEQSSVKLRPYGTNSLLQVTGELSATLENRNGARHQAVVYVINSQLAEPLLGDADAKALGILKIDANGSLSHQADTVGGIVDSLEASGIAVKTSRTENQDVTKEEQGTIQKIVEKHPRAFQGVGLLKDVEVKLNVDSTVAPVAAPYRPIPLAYQERLSAHLKELREEGKIEDVGPHEECTWISNVVITEKKEPGQIRMNVDMREANKAIQRTPRHVTTVQEMRHMLAGAVRFSELDMNHGFHQIGLARESRPISTFRTHEGLHRFKVLFFGASPASDVFHAIIASALKGLNGCVSIHDNILIWGRTPKEHAENLDACLTRLEEQGLTLRREKCNLGKTSVSWFGWTFSASGMSADPRKLDAVRAAGRPQDADDVKSFLQACQYNAKFMIRSEQAYAQMTHPLRVLTHKNARFVWGEEQERAYQDVMRAMTSEDALRPFDPKLQTKLVTDAGPEGIAASLFQVSRDGTWIPVDHASRSLTPCEKNYSQFEKESLAQAWGMQAHRQYLLGIKFETMTDHKPLLGVFNGSCRGNARVQRHKLKTQEFQYRMTHLPGKQNPCDYASRHPRPLVTYDSQQLDKMLVEHDDEVHVNAVICNDLPDALTKEMVQDATARDRQSQKLIKSIKQGYLSKDAELARFKQIFPELTYTQGVVLRGDRIFIPKTEPEPGMGNLRTRAVELAHEGHQGVEKSKKLLRACVWFPGMDTLMEEKVSGCIACQATVYKPTRDPLCPSTLPERPWQKVSADFWGPLSNGEYLLVVIDDYSRFPEVEITSSTSGQSAIPLIDKIFATHGMPETVRTDGGPPFNGHEFAAYARWAGFKHQKTTPEDPEANGLVENFMKAIKKTWHTARVEHKNPKQELYKLLRQYRATPHTSTGRPPAELLFNRAYRARLPATWTERPTQPSHDDQGVRDAHQKAKQTQKAYKDRPANVTPHNIRRGDTVLLLGQRSKTTPRYDPLPYTVTSARGTQITAARGQQTVTRDAQKFKRVCLPSLRPNYRQQRYPLDRYHDEGPSLGPVAPVSQDCAGSTPGAHRAPRTLTSPAPPSSAGTATPGPVVGATPTPDPVVGHQQTHDPPAAGRPKRRTRPPAYCSDYVPH